MRSTLSLPARDRAHDCGSLFVSAGFREACRLALLLAILTATSSAAQDVSPTTEKPAPLLLETARRVALDPTTYAPAVLVYTANRLDWDSSQEWFRHGYVERNPRFTLSGRADDVPISFDAGKDRILHDSLGLLARMAANNAASAVVERLLINRAPRHRKLIRTLGWIERGCVASYFSYRLSAEHVRQWRANERPVPSLTAR